MRGLRNEHSRFDSLTDTERCLKLLKTPNSFTDKQVKRGEAVVEGSPTSAASSSHSSTSNGVAAQKATAEASMMAKALASLTSGGVTAAVSTPSGTSAINKPAILSAIVRNASGRHFLLLLLHLLRLRHLLEPTPQTATTSLDTKH